ncbi:MAG TPA: hypothetical protein DIS79_02485 [Bacteroidetes bacterium]|nr:hypothetical protein [Bacteroidota bacterium]HRK06045.1 LytTR family DNA-binding domain-containing protein [Chlorobiota bacterium]
MRAVIIDDERNVRMVIRSMVHTYAPSVKIVGEASTCLQGIDIIRTMEPDVAFLDVELGDGTGMDVIASVKDLSCLFAVVTAHSSYAVDAYAHDAVSFLLKPVDPDAIVKAIAKLSAALEARQILAEKSQLRRVTLRDAENDYVVRIADILTCTAKGVYTVIRMTDGSSLLLSKNLKEYEDMFSQYGFLRVHHGHLVNVHHIRRYDRRHGHVLVLSDDSVVPVSVRKREVVLRTLHSVVLGNSHGGQ